MFLEINEQTQGDSNSKPFPTAGTSSGWHLEKVTREASSTKADADPSKQVIAFHFINKNGAEYRYAKFDVDEARTRKKAEDSPKTAGRDEPRYGLKKGDIISPEVAVARAYGFYADAVKHILTKLIAPENVVIKASNYDEMVQVINNLLSSHAPDYKNVDLTLKLVYNEDGYLGFPTFPNFVEVTGTEPSTLYIGKNELIVKPNADRNENHPADSKGEGKDDDDLPF
jgi:hypothetical protein